MLLRGGATAAVKPHGKGSEKMNVCSPHKQQIKAPQYKAVWGNKFIENPAKDIKLEFPVVTGNSARNLKYMEKFARLFPDFEIVHTQRLTIFYC